MVVDVPREGSKQLIIIYLVYEGTTSKAHGEHAVNVSIVPPLVLEIIYVRATKKPHHSFPIFTPNSVD